jgi:alkanesulfonate monooxygenase SsuD/methylene tetrahydromethanopterin reductase-like flavin-dependent oxidoreductase (luciferase family)
MGLGYSYAQFFSGEMDKAALDTYRQSFVPSPYMDKSFINVCYMVTTAETREEAEYEAKPFDIYRLQFMRGRIEQYMTPEEAKDYPLTEMDKMMIQENRKLHFVGSAKEVADQLIKEQEKYGFDEAMICSIPHSQEARLNVYRLLARELM